MFASIVALLALQATQPGSIAAPPAAAAASTEDDVYTRCFLRELAAAVGRDVATSPAPFSKKKALGALRRCQGAKAELTQQIERELAADPAYAEPRLRSLEGANRVMVTELAMLLLIRMRGR